MATPHSYTSAQLRDGAGLRPVTSRLTNREWEILDLLTVGMTTDEIAADIGISPLTVSTHTKSILRKLELHSRAQAVSWALELRDALMTRHRAGTDHR